jgi:hypothetical protein
VSAIDAANPSNEAVAAPLLSDRVAFSAIVDRPKLVMPNQGRVLVWIIVNVEHWTIERAMPRTVLSPPMGQPLLPDLPNWAWHEYGMRVGFWRILEALKARARTGALVLVSLHEPALAGRFADRIVALAEGRIAADGPPEVVLGPGFMAATYGVETGASQFGLEVRGLVADPQPSAGARVAGGES